MTARILTLLAITFAVPAHAATTTKIETRYDRSNCPKQPPMAVGLKRCPALPPMLVAQR